MKIFKRLMVIYAFGLIWASATGVWAQVAADGAERIPAHSVQEIRLSPKGRMEKASFQSSGGISMGYWVYTPGDSGSTKLPLIIYLHGSSLRGTDLNQVLGRGLPKYLENTIDIPAIVLCPQCPGNRYWWDSIMISVVMEFLEEMKRLYPVDVGNISLTGHSMGGDGTWMIAAAHPDSFTRILPVSGSMRTSEASRYGSLPVWAFVAERDNNLIDIVNINRVRDLRELGGRARLTFVLGTDHGSVPNSVYFEQEVLDWLMGK